MGAPPDDNGPGVPQDYAEAVKWYRKAAERGDALAQNNLGFMYDYGQGVPEDDLLAHIWYNLAAAARNEDAEKGCDIVTERMRPAQIVEAQQLARAWRPRKHVAAAPSRPDAVVAKQSRHQGDPVRRHQGFQKARRGPHAGLLCEYHAPRRRLRGVITP